MLQSLIQINPNIQAVSPLLDHVFSFLTFMGAFIPTLYGAYKIVHELIEAGMVKSKERCINSEKLAALMVELELVKKQRDSDNMLLQELLKDFDENKDQIYGLIRDIKDYSKEQITLMIELVKTK